MWPRRTTAPSNQPGASTSNRYGERPGSPMLDLAAVERWIASMGKTSGATVVIRAYGVLAAILDDAVKARRLASNPARGVENLPKRHGKRHVYLSTEDVGRLAHESGDRRVLVLVLAYCGLRWGEAIALRVRDVEFLRRRLSVHANAVQIGAKHEVGPTKGRVARSVPVPQFVLDELAAQCEGRSLDDLVFGDGDNYLPRPKSSNGWFTRAVKSAEVQAITPHDLRHSCASIAKMRGIASDASFGVVGDWDPLRDFSFGAAADPVWRYGRHAV